MNHYETISTEEHEKQNDKTYFGFWVYLMTDLTIFAVLFATYSVMHGNTFGGARNKTKTPSIVFVSIITCR